MVISFATVTVSAYRVSYLNIVTAVRGLPAPLNESSSSLKEIIFSFDRQFLHAKTLGFVHPSTGKNLEFNVKLPHDLNNLIKKLRNACK